MLALRIILILMGLLFIGFGYNIWVKGKYDLINNFEKDKKSGKKNESFAKRVGIIEFSGGVACLALGIIAMFLDDAYTLIFFIFCIVSIIIVLIVNHIKSSK